MLPRPIHRASSVVVRAAWRCVAPAATVLALALGVACAAPPAQTDPAPTVARSPVAEPAAPTPSTDLPRRPNLAPVTSDAPAPIEPPAPKAVVETHVVRSGESLGDLAAARGLQLATLLAANDLTDADRLLVGQELRIPAADGVLHTVQPGETLSSIAERYEVDLAAVISANGLSARPDLLTPGTEILVVGATPVVRRAPPASTAGSASQPARGPLARSYAVRDGDTLGSIAQVFGVDILSLVAQNGLDNADLLVTGRELAIPGQSREHVVQAGQTLATIAQQYDVDLPTLLAANAFEDPNLVRVGTPLIIPAGRKPASSVAPGSAPTPPPTRKVEAPRPSSAPPVAAPAPSGERAITALVTGYAPGAGASSSHTASGTITHWGTVAADTRLYPFGTRLRIEGFDDTVFVVEDTGSAVRGNVLDIFFADVATARRFGTQTLKVSVLSAGS